MRRTVSKRTAAYLLLAVAPFYACTDLPPSATEEVTSMSLLPGSSDTTRRGPAHDP